MFANSKMLKRIKQKNKDFIFMSHLKLLPIWTKSNFSAFLLNSRHFEFQISPTLDKTPSLFAETIFVLKNVSKKFFFDGMGVRALSGPRKRGRACPPFHRKKKFETIFNEKIVFAKSQGILFRIWLIWNSKCLEFSKKAEKFDFVQIGSSFKCHMRMIFYAFWSLQRK